MPMAQGSPVPDYEPKGRGFVDRDKTFQRSIRTLLRLFSLFGGLQILLIYLVAFGKGSLPSSALTALASGLAAQAAAVLIGAFKAWR